MLALVLWLGVGARGVWAVSAPGSRAYLCRSCNFVEGDRVSAQFFEGQDQMAPGRDG